MPDLVVDADTINTFKNRLDKHGLDQDVVYNVYAKLTGTAGSSILDHLYMMLNKLAKRNTWACLFKSIG